MGTDAPTGVPVPGRRVSVAATLRWTVPLAVVAIGFLVAVTFRARPSPGLTGQRLVVTLALVAFALALGSYERVRPTLLRRLLLLATMVAAAATLVAVQPGGPSFLFMFPPVSAAAFRLTRPLASAVASVAVVAMVLAAALGASRSFDATVLQILALAAYWGVAVFAGRFIRADEQSQFLIAQLEETRAAQAEAATLAERQRLAREMHDVLAHSLSGLVINLEATRAMVEGGVAGEPLEAALERAHGLARTGLVESRRAIEMLRDDDLPGPQKVERLCQDFTRDTAVPCAFAVSGGEAQLAREVHLAIYRVAQEALTNVRKHASPERVEVGLSLEPAGARLVVEDFRTADRPSPPGGGTGYGLMGMRERAALIGASLDAGATDHGFRVELWVPTTPK